MMNAKLIISLFLSVMSMTLYSAENKSIYKRSTDPVLLALKSKVKPRKVLQKLAPVIIKKGTSLEVLYRRKAKSKAFFAALKDETLKHKQNAVPILTKVMKSSKYPEENRWIATFMLGRIMGKKSADFISKFVNHPNWMLRLSSLKVLLHLRQDKYKGLYVKSLADKSLIVRHQALQNIKEMKITGLAPYIWKMMYDKSNYLGKEGDRKRSHIIRDIIKTVGDLGFRGARKPMLKMIQKKKYKDIYTELDYSLSKLSTKSSPKGSLAIKRNFWNKIALKELTI